MFPLLLTVLVLLRFLISCIAYLFGGQGCGLGPETHQRLVSSQLFTSRAQDVIFDQIVEATLVR